MVQLYSKDIDAVDYYIRVNYLHKTNSELAENLNTTVGSITHRLSKLNIKRPSKYNFNHHYFKVVSTDMMYILGYLFADGYVRHTNGYLVCIELGIKDVNILYEMAERLGECVPFSLFTRKKDGVERGYCKIAMYSKEMYKDLLGWGLTERKSLTCDFPMLPSKYTADFIRGYWDGDGCISAGPTLKGKDCFICCSYDFGNYLECILNKNGINTIRPRLSKIIKIRISTKSDNLKRLFYFLYGEKKPDMCLDRKYQLLKTFS